MEQNESWMSEQLVPILMVIGVGLLIYYLGSFFIKFVIKQAVNGKYRKANKHDIEKRRKTLSGIVLAIWRIIVIVTVGASLLKIFIPTIDFAPIFASAGIVGIALAFGAQSLVKDFITGIFIISENQYRIGDYVSINDADGRVEQVGTRSTVIRDDNGNVHYLPNGSIVHVVNKTMGYSKVHFSLMLHASSDLDAAVSVINQVGDKLAADEKWKARVLSAPQFASIGAITGSSIEVTVSGKTQPSDQWAVTAEMRKRLLRAFEKESIKLA